MAHGNLTYVLVLSVIIFHDLHQKFGKLSFVTAQQSGPCCETAFLTLVKSTDHFGILSCVSYQIDVEAILT